MTLNDVITFWIYFKGGKVYSCGQTQLSLGQKRDSEFSASKKMFTLLLYF